MGIQPPQHEGTVRSRCLLHLDGEVACRCCNSLRYAVQRTSSYGRKTVAMRKIRRKLGDYGLLRVVTPPPKPRLLLGPFKRQIAKCLGTD